MTVPVDDVDDADEDKIFKEQNNDRQADIHGTTTRSVRPSSDKSDDVEFLALFELFEVFHLVERRVNVILLLLLEMLLLLDFIIVSIG